MTLELPAVNYFDEKASFVDTDGERKTKVLSHVMTVPFFIEHTDIIAVSAAPLTEENLEEVMRMRGSRIWLRGGGGVDINMRSDKLNQIWRNAKDKARKEELLTKFQ